MEKTTTAPLFSIRTLSEYLGISEWTVRRLAKAGTITYRRVGAQVRFTPEDVEQYLRSCAAKPHKKGRKS